MFQGRSPEAAAIAYPSIPDEPDVVSLVEDMRKDYQVAIAILAIRSNIRRVEASVTVGDSDDPKAKALADQLTRLWYRTLRDLSESVEFGRAAFQKRWRNDPKTGLTVVEKLEYIPPALCGKRFSELLLDKQGRFDGVRLKGHDHQVDIPPEDAWWFGLDATITEPYGRSRYLGAAQEVRKDRKLILKLRQTFWKKYVLRGGVAHVEPTVHDAKTGEPIDNFAATAANLEALNSGGWLLLPSTRDSSGNLMNDFTTLPETLDPTPLENSLDGTDAEISRALGIHEKLISEGSAVGALNAVVSHAAMALAMVEEIVDQKVQSFNQYVVEKVEARNFPAGSRPGLKMVYASLTKGENSSLVQLVNSWLTNNTMSPLLLTGKIDVAQILSSCGIPLEPGAAKGIAEAIEKARDRQERQADARIADPHDANAEGGASGFRQIGDRPDEQGGDGGDPDKTGGDE